jgi:DNA-binding transcriptional LysR family regulator
MSRTQLKLKGLSLDRLETLSKIVSQGGITRAAGGDTSKQSQFSRQIAELESWFGINLLDRSSTPVKPTTAALRIAREVDEFLRGLDSLREEAGSGRKTVVFGAGERMIRSYLIPWASKISGEGVCLVFKNHTSGATRTELLAKRLDFGILRKDRCPSGFASIAMKPIPICLLLPAKFASIRSTWSWKDLSKVPLLQLEGDERFSDFLRERCLDASVELDVAAEFSSWTQLLDGMQAFQMGGFAPKDLEGRFPTGFTQVPLPQLSDYADQYVIAWSASEAEKRPELQRLVKFLKGK